MTLAWSKFRYERGAFTFAAALSHAWSWQKGNAAREAAAKRYRAAAEHPMLYLRHNAKSPIQRSLAGRAYAYTQARDAGRLTSRLGA
jgi:hypothetical protein